MKPAKLSRWQPSGAAAAEGKSSKFFSDKKRRPELWSWRILITVIGKAITTRLKKKVSVDNARLLSNTICWIISTVRGYWRNNNLVNETQVINKERCIDSPVLTDTFWKKFPLTPGRVIIRKILESSRGYWILNCSSSAQSLKICFKY